MKKDKLIANYNLRNLNKERFDKINASKVLVAGSGKIAQQVLTDLISSGVGTIGTIEHENCEKLIPKLKKFNHNVIIQIHSNITDYEDIGNLFKNYDIVIDCLQDYNLKILLNELAVKNSIPLVYGSVTKNYGQAFAFIPDETVCLNCLYAKKDLCKLVSHAETSLITDAVAAIQTDLAVQYLMGYKDEILNYLYTYNISNLKFNKIKLSKKSDCEICAKVKTPL